jgi:hypothetical protein
VAVYFFAIAAIYSFLARPLIRKIEAKNSKIQEIISDQEMKKEKIMQIPALKNQFEMVVKDEERIDIFLSRDNLVGLIEKIEKVSEETGNKIKIELSEEQLDKKNTKSKKDAEKGKTSSINLPSDNYIKMKMTLSGDYAGLLNFINKIENADYYSDIISFKITDNLKNSGNSSGNPFSSSTPREEGAVIIPAESNILSIIEAVFYLKK